MSKKTKQCDRALKRLYDMLNTETAGKVPKTIRRHISRCSYCREQMAALRTEMTTTIAETAVTKQALQVLMKKQERADVKKESLFARIKAKFKRLNRWLKRKRRK